MNVTCCFETADCQRRAMVVSVGTCWLTDGSVIRDSALLRDCDERVMWMGGCVWVSPRRWKVAQAES